MDLSAVRLSARAFGKAVVKGDTAEVSNHLAADLKAQIPRDKHLPLVGMTSYRVTKVVPVQDDVVIEARYVGAGERGKLQARWVQESGVPKIAALNLVGPAGPRDPWEGVNSLYTPRDPWELPKKG